MIYHLGDIVDRRKFINYVTLNRLREMFIDPCEKNGIELNIIVGNHDIPYRNTNKINAINELMPSKNNIINLFSEPAEVDFDGMLIAMMPWINNTNYTDCMDFIHNTKAEVLFGHLELNGFEMYRGMKNDHGMDTDPFKKFDVVCSGHFHHKSSHGNIHYLGNPYETTWNDYNDQRGFHIFDSDTRELTFIQNPYRMFYKIWYDDVDISFEKIIEKYNFEEYENTYVKVIIQNKTNPYWFDLVMDNLYKANPANVSIVEDNKHMEMFSEDEIINEAEDTLASLHKYVDNMNTDIDKKKLNQLFSALYIEAQSITI